MWLFPVLYDVRVKNSGWTHMGNRAQTQRKNFLYQKYRDITFMKDFWAKQSKYQNDGIG